MSITLENIRDVLIDHVHRLFKGSGATNYLTYSVTDKDSNESFSITIQKEGGLTVSEKLAQQNERIRVLEAGLGDAIYSLKDGLKDHCPESERSKADRILLDELKLILGRVE